MSAAAELLRQLSARGIEPGQRRTDDSRMVQPGDLFLAYPVMLSTAVATSTMRSRAGGSCALGERGYDTAAPPCRGRRQWPACALAGSIAHAVLGEPSERLSLIALTGTNGKTSCSQWIARAHPRRCAIIGTLGAGFPGRLTETGFTTPQATTLARCLADFVRAGGDACALEASSIGIAEGRMNGAHIDIAAFTNLTRDHLDYHGTMEAYAAAKEQLFLWPGCVPPCSISTIRSACISRPAARLA